MNLFDIVPGDFFSPLASPNRRLYADALDVLYLAYREELKLPELKLYSMLRNRMEAELAEANFEGEDIDEEELKDLSGRARFLIRKLCAKGWIEKERGQNFEEYLTVPNYSSSILELLHDLRDEKPAHGYSLVFGTYSTLKVANESEEKNENAYEKMVAVYEAYQNTQDLIKLLKKVYHSVKHYFQLQIQMQDVNEVLASHFDGFGVRVMEAYIKPLKIRDSVPKYRVPIQSILREWAENDILLTKMAGEAFAEKREKTLEACRHDLLRKMFWIEDRYENIEIEFLNEIDVQVRRYTRAATQKIENLTNRDQNIRGDLNTVLEALAKKKHSQKLDEALQDTICLYEQQYLTEKSLWHRKRPGKRSKGAPVLIEETEPEEEAFLEAEKIFHTEYGREAVNDYVMDWLGDGNRLISTDLDVSDDKAYVMSLMAILNREEETVDYEIQELDGKVSKNGYTIPFFEIRRKEKVHES